MREKICRVEFGYLTVNKYMMGFMNLWKACRFGLVKISSIACFSRAHIKLSFAAFPVLGTCFTLKVLQALLKAVRNLTAFFHFTKDASNVSQSDRMVHMRRILFEVFNV